MPNHQSQVNGHKRAMRPHRKSRSAAAQSRSEAGQEPDAAAPSGRSAVGAAAGALARAGNLQSRTQEALAEQRRHMTGRVNKMRDVLIRVSELVRSEHEGVSRYLDQAGQKAEDVAHYIGSADLRTLRSDAQRLARNNPAWFVGGALVAGFALGRLFKASTPRAIPEGRTTTEDDDE
jgi:hypothetical protein